MSASGVETPTAAGSLAMSAQAMMAAAPAPSRPSSQRRTTFHLQCVTCASPSDQLNRNVIACTDVDEFFVSGARSAKNEDEALCRQSEVHKMKFSRNVAKSSRGY